MQKFHSKLLSFSALGNVTELYPMNWRFLPTIDWQVGLFMSRDLDSLISKREVAAVEEWLYSPKSFHMMRDHPQHLSEIMGGLWGLKVRKMERFLMVNSFILGSQDSVLYGLLQGHNDQFFMFL